MQRRELITLVGSAAAATWPIVYFRQSRGPSFQWGLTMRSILFSLFSIFTARCLKAPEDGVAQRNREDGRAGADPHRHFPCVILMPVGPVVEMENLNDTLASIFKFLTPPHRIILIDNTVHGIVPTTLKGSEFIDIFRCPNSTGYCVTGELYLNSSRAILYALGNYSFDVLLRLDDDALLIGSGADRQAIEYFQRNADVGCLGSYRVTCTGNMRDFNPARLRLEHDLRLRSGFRRPFLWLLLRSIVRKARRNGYEDGEHCLGAAVFFNPNALLALREKKLLGRKELLHTSLIDDHLFGLLNVAAGFKNGDFALPGMPLGLAWRGLPASPQQLVAWGKKIIHSVKSASGQQRAIREEFRVLLTDQSGKLP